MSRNELEGPLIFLIFQTRYLIKYRHVDSQLVLKVTDDKVVRQS